MRRLGLILLDTQFPRPLGDVGNPATFAVPVVQRRVAGAVPRSIVCSAAALRAAGLAPAFVAAARALAEDGVDAIATSCGFLVLLQAELQAAVQVPVVTSALLLLPALLQRQRRVGVLSADAASLGDEHLRAAGVADDRLADVLVTGMPADGEFARAVLGDRPSLDERLVGAEAVASALALQRRCADLRTLVLECTNLPPYAAALAAATGWQVVSLLDLPPLDGMVVRGATPAP